MGKNNIYDSCSPYRWTYIFIMTKGYVGWNLINYCIRSVHCNGNKINKIMLDHLSASQGTK